MSLASRALNYFRVCCTIGGLHRRTNRLTDRPEALMREAFGFCNGFFIPNQVESELIRLMEDVRRLRPKTVVEIGTSMGGTLYLWTRLSAPDATLVSVDLPGGKFGGGYSRLRTPLYRSFARESQQLHLLRGDSHQPSTVDRVRLLLGGREVDFLFIDGDHTYAGVKHDWKLYSPLVRPGGLVAFHDIAGVYADTEVKRFWDELKPGFDYREYADHPKGQYGIGVLTTAP